MLVSRFLFLCAFIGYVSSQAITKGMMTKIFKFAKPAAVTTLTKVLNGQANAALQIPKIAPWAKKNFGKPPKTSKDPYANQTFAVGKAKEFCKHRDALKLFMTSFRQTLNKSVGVAATDKLIVLFWTEDKKNNNNLTQSLADFFKDAPSKISPSKVAIVSSELAKAESSFAQTNPAAAQALTTFTL